MKKIFSLFLFFIGLNFHSQNIPNGIENNLTPNGVLEKIFDQNGNVYKLSDIIVGKEVRDTNGVLLRATNPTPMTCGYYNLYFEDGCGMDNVSDLIHIARRNVVCQVFTDLSNFINSPLTASGKKVNIWVRNINNVIVSPNSSVGILGLASSFYSMPYNASVSFGGVVDNETWKTIHTGLDSYSSITSPLISNGIETGTSGVFYHGVMAFNFTDTTSPITWNTNLTSNTSFPNDYDLYSVVLHEVTHALGFASLISANGSSKFGVGYNYYSRYDRFLKTSTTVAPTNVFLLTTSTTCTNMYNYVFNTALNSNSLAPAPNSPCSSNTTVCAKAIRYVGTSTVPVFTPNCFTPTNSLSHFEDLCVSPNINNAYFAMSDAIGKGVRKRFLKPEERNTLGDLGYTLNINYGTTSTYLGTINYGSIFNGITVAGTNDGLNSDATYKYIGNVNVPIIINSSSDSTKRILLNDTPSTTNFECLEDVFDTAASFSIRSGTSLTNVTMTTSVSGLHLLRYVPRNSTGTQKGNITYIYVFINDSYSGCSILNSCDLILNGNFEANNNIIPNNLGQIGSACGWSRGNNQTPDYFNTLSTNNLIKIPCNYFGFENDKVLGNNAYAGMAISNPPSAFPNIISEPIMTTLKSPLLPNQNYQLKFNVSITEKNNLKIKFQAYFSQSPILGLYNGNIPISSSGIFLENLTFSDINDGWETIVFNFQTTSAANHQYLYIGGLNGVSFQDRVISPEGCSSIQNITNYYYVDNVSLIQLNGGSFILPTTICNISQSLPNLITYLTALPTNGVFSGPGVTLNSGVYSLNSSIMPLGSNTISYTYTNSSGCSVVVYSNINVEDCRCSCLSTIYYTYTTSGNVVTFNVLNSNLNCSISSMSPLKLYWDFGDGTVVYNGGSVFSHTYPTSGTYVVKMTPSIMSPADVVICNSKSINNTIVISSGRTVIDVNNQILSDSVSIYPNPTSSKVNIKLFNNVDEEITILLRTVDGKELFSKVFRLDKGSQIIELDLPINISEGLILIEVKSKILKVVKNLIIKK